MFDYYDTAYFIIIFILIFVVFYIIITNFGYSITFKRNFIENKIDNIQSEIISINSKINNTQTTNEKKSNNLHNSENNNNELINNELESYKKLLKQKNNHINILKKQQKINNSKEDINGDEDEDINVVVNKNTTPPRFNQTNTIMFDPIANYDNAKILDPLIDPLQRTSADQIPTPSIAMQLNFPSQGVLDKYHRLGLLVAIDTSDNNSTDSSNNIIKRKAQVPVVTEKNERSYNGIWLAEKGKIEGFGDMNYDNNILELMGKRRYHNVYRYFTSISMGNKIIKVMVNNKNNKELYSGDIIFIKELNKSFRVEIDDMDMIEYNPYMI